MVDHACHLDFETFSTAPLKVCGAYHYAQHPTTEILCCCWAIDDAAVCTWVPRLDDDEAKKFRFPRNKFWHYGHALPEPLAEAVRSGMLVIAHNAQFERSIWQAIVVRRHKGPPIKRSQFVCTAARAAAANLPRSLEGVGMALDTKHKKDKEGTRLLTMFAKPRKPTKNDQRIRVLPLDAPDEFRKLCDYCADDVRTERDVDKLMPPLYPSEQALYTFDMEINERGLLLDIPLVRKASVVLKRLEQDIIQDVQRRTVCDAWPEGLRPTQRDKMMQFFSSIGVELENLQADHVRKYLKTNVATLPTLARELLLLRIEAGKSSTKKFVSMMACTTRLDHRARGTLLFHGGSTGRWAGRLIQPQNFARGYLKYPEQLRIFDLLQKADHEIMSMLYEWPISAIGSCMRGFILPSPGKILRVVDYSSIEARVLAWLAEEHWVLQAYVDGLDVYKLMASGVFNVRYEDVTDEQRRIGKNLVLGCGYGLGGAKFVAYSEKAGVEITEAFAKAAVKSYRTKHPKIITFWYDVERAAVGAVREKRTLEQAVVLRNLKFYVDSQWLCIELPQGRCLRYYRPKVVPVEKFGQPSLQLQFKTEFRGRLVSESTYGGKLTENITQAVARDILANGMYEAERSGYRVMGTVHDEILTEQYPHEGSVHELEQNVCRLPVWAKGLPIAAEGFESYRYRKA